MIDEFTVSLYMYICNDQITLLVFLSKTVILLIELYYSQNPDLSTFRDSWINVFTVVSLSYRS